MNQENLNNTNQNEVEYNINNQSQVNNQPFANMNYVQSSSLNQQISIVENKYASVGKRIGAFIIDTLYLTFIGILIFILGMIVKIILKYNGNFVSYVTYLFSILLPLIGQPFYCLFAESGKKHATIGKRTFHLVIKNENSSYLTFSQSIGRFILKILLSSFQIISVITIIASDKKQTLYDMILGQVVVEE